MSFLYFAPAGTPVEANSIAESPIGYAFEGACASRECSEGPSGHPGVVLGQPGTQIGYFPHRQTWRQHFADERYWVGMWNDPRPAESDLRREESLPGKWIGLSDGAAWHVPIARSWVDDGPNGCGWISVLPAQLDINVQGQWIKGDIKPRYGRLFELANKWWDHTAASIRVNGAPPVEVMSAQEQFDGCAEALGFNYRIGKVEIVLLGLLDVMIKQRILDVLIDRARLDEFLKKKLKQMETGTSSPAVGNSCIVDGAQDLHQGTARP